jgi:hypothetical protein
MSIPLTKRTRGCLYLLKHQFDIEATIDFVIRECADEPAMQRAQDKRKLARNIVTIGSTGDQQQLNLVAFKDALREFDEERQQRLMAEHKRELDTLNGRVRDAEQRAYAAERDFRQLAARAASLQESEAEGVTHPAEEKETILA